MSEPSDRRPDAGSVGGCCAIVLGLDLVGLVCFIAVAGWLLGWL